MTGGAGFIGSHYVRTPADRRLPGLPRTPRSTVLDKLTYAGNLANLAPVADSPRYRFVQGDICDAELVARGHAGARRGRALRRRVARRPLDHGCGRLRARPTCSAPRRCSRPRCDAGRAAVRARLHRRGVRLDRRRAPGTRRDPLEPELAVLGVQGRHRPARPRLRAAPTAWTCRVTRCSNNYGPYQFPEKVIPLFVTNLIDGRHGAALRRRAQRPRLAARRRPLPRASSWCWRRAAPARSTTSAAAPS